MVGSKCVASDLTLRAGFSYGPVQRLNSVKILLRNSNMLLTKKPQVLIGCLDKVLPETRALFTSFKFQIVSSFPSGSLAYGTQAECGNLSCIVRSTLTNTEQYSIHYSHLT